jgi:hypothetical protein
MSTAAAAAAKRPIRSTIPARLDRLKWSPFHTRMVLGLGAAWILDGLQITISSSVTGVLTKQQTLHMTSTEIGLIASIYLVGEVFGALIFGKLSDRLGRKRLLIVTLLLYLCGTGLAAFVTGHHTGWLVFFYLTRFIAGMGIGGQYAAINSAIDEMMPSHYRGRVDIWINGTYWAGAIIGSLASLIFLNAFSVNVGWRLAFLTGPVLALIVIVVGRTLPESPRWLMTHGRMEEAEENLKKIEDAAVKTGQTLEPVDDSKAIELIPEKKYGYIEFLKLVFKQYPKRAIQWHHGMTSTDTASEAPATERSRRGSHGCGRCDVTRKASRVRRVDELSGESIGGITDAIGSDRDLAGRVCTWAPAASNRPLIRCRFPGAAARRGHGELSQ